MRNRGLSTDPVMLDVTWQILKMRLMYIRFSGMRGSFVWQTEFADMIFKRSGDQNKMNTKEIKKVMGYLELLLIGVGLAMDAFAVSICKGLNMKNY